MAELPPPDVAAAAAIVNQWLDSGSPPQKVNEEQYRAMSNAQRLDYVRAFPQHLESGIRKA